MHKCFAWKRKIIMKLEFRSFDKINQANHMHHKHWVSLIAWKYFPTNFNKYSLTRDIGLEFGYFAYAFRKWKQTKLKKTQTSSSSSTEKKREKKFNEAQKWPMKGCTRCGCPCCFCCSYQTNWLTCFWAISWILTNRFEWFVMWWVLFKICLVLLLFQNWIARCISIYPY